jgi:hypothetical protein
VLGNGWPLGVNAAPLWHENNGYYYILLSRALILSNLGAA